MSNTIPTVTSGQTQRLGSDKADYEKYVVVDTTGAVVNEGQVFVSLDLIKDENQSNTEQILTDMFASYGMEFKIRTQTANKVVRKVSAKELLAKFGGK